jgi:UDP-N-acetylmuramoyl-L-alanyl-D-glutamate--2,6-diaminopimelate ligase
LEAKKLFEILGDQLIEIKTGLNGEVSSIEIDSRKSKKDSCYVALKGYTSDGHLYITDAILNGAKYVVCEVMPLALHDDITYVHVKDSREAAGMLAHHFYGNPSQEVTIVGVTGTNGKTTVATLLHQLYTALGYKCGLISTVENIIGLDVIASTHTTPDSVSIAKLMHDMVSAACTYIFMEVSSHALDQKRTVGINFKAAIFTNITHDHLDYHVTFKNYIDTKKIFFDRLEDESIAIVNMDDRNGNIMVQNSKAKIFSYSLKSMTDYRCKIISDDISGLHLKINNEEIYCMMAGAFNAYNITAVYATAKELGEEPHQVLSILSSLQGAEGRMTKVQDKVNGKVGIVDYAHTPDALENVLKTIKSSLNASQKVLTVVGCGGDRDATKRPIMAKIAAQYSDRVIFTSDNPRSEDPEKILDDMVAGLDAQQHKSCLRIPDRLMAIKTAVMLASKGDVVLIAGKGHEKYQDIKGVKHPFEDKKILAEAFSSSV